MKNLLLVSVESVALSNVAFTYVALTIFTLVSEKSVIPFSKT